MVMAGDDRAAKKNQAREGGVVSIKHLAGDQRIHFIGVERFELGGGRHGDSWAKFVRENRVSK
jgi:hypothetical protein